MKFYISRTYRKAGFEDKALLEVLKFAFDVMGLQKLSTLVFETNNYYLKSLLYMGFKLIKLKPKADDGTRRMLLQMTSMLDV